MTFPKKSWLCSGRQAVSFTACVEEHWKHSVVRPRFPLLHLQYLCWAFFLLFSSLVQQQLPASQLGLWPGAAGAPPPPWWCGAFQPKQGSAATLQEIPADHTAMYKALDPRAVLMKTATGTSLGNTVNLVPWSKYQSTRIYQNLI